MTPITFPNPPRRGRGAEDIAWQVWDQLQWLANSSSLATGGGGGGPTNRDLLVCWSGVTPSVLGNGTTWRVPYDTDGSSFAFTLARAFARIETPYTSDISYRLEKSAGGDVVFSPTTITSIVIPAGDYETEVTGLSTVVNSGDLIRIVFTAVGGISPYHAELIGTT